jgi:bifunctional DNase/RNase
MLSKKTHKYLIVVGICLIALLELNAETILERVRADATEQEDLLRVDVHDLIIDPLSKKPVVVLSDADEDRAIYIWIGDVEARAIYAEIKGITNPRPLTHDLLAKVVQSVDGEIQRIVITHIEENIYFAKLVIKKGDSLVDIDARPSDSIVMALKFEAPIFVSRDLYEKMAIPTGEQKDIEQKYGLTLQDLTPSLAEYLAFKSDRGVLVSGVQPGSRADEDGIKAGDIFAKIAGEAVADVSDMRAVLEKSKTTVKARIFRKDRWLSITLHLE